MPLFSKLISSVTHLISTPWAEHPCEVGVRFFVLWMQKLKLLEFVLQISIIIEGLVFEVVFSISL